MVHAAPNVSEQTVQFYTYLLLYLMFNPLFKSIMERTAPKRCATCSLKQWRVARQAHSAVTGKVAGAFGLGRSGGSCHWQAHIAVAGPVAGALDGGRSSGSCPCHAEILLPLIFVLKFGRVITRCSAKFCIVYRKDARSHLFFLLIITLLCVSFFRQSTNLECLMLVWLLVLHDKMNKFAYLML